MWKDETIHVTKYNYSQWHSGTQKITTKWVHNTTGCNMSWVQAKYILPILYMAQIPNDGPEWLSRDLRANMWIVSFC